MTNKHRQAKLILYGAIAVGVIVLMLPISFRLTAIQHEFWNMGHAIGFAFLFALLPRAHVYFSNLSAVRYYLIAFIIAGLFAVVTESIQQFIPGRSISIVDMYLDVLGALMGCTIYMLFKEPNTRAYYSLILIVGFVGLLYPSHIVFIDEYIKRQQFPVLSDIRYKSELRRWTGETNKVLCVDSDFAEPDIGKIEYETFVFEPKNSVIFSNQIPKADIGMCGLMVPISNKKYSGSFLRYMSPNWEEYETLSISLYAEEASSLTFRVNDFKHGLSFDYHDRFSQIIIVQPGMNKIEFNLDMIKNAPQTREMNMREISSLGIISTAPHTLTSYVVFSVELK